MKNVIVIISILFLSGCSGLGGQNSGFLDDYSQLRPSSHIDGARVYQNPKKNITDYNNFMIEPVRVQFIKSREKVAIDPEKLSELTRYFRNKMEKELRSGGYRVVNSAGNDTLIFRIAIVDIKKAIAALNIHPATKMSGAGLGGAAIEAEGVDTMGNRIFAFTHSKKGNRMSLTAGLSAWGHAEQAMDFWAKKTVERLDEIRQSKQW